MSEELNADSVVSYTVKDMFDKVDRRFDKQDRVLDDINLRMDGLATKEEVSDLHHRVDGVVQSVTRIEDERQAEKVAAKTLSDQHSTWARRATFIVASVFIPLAVALILVFVH